MRTMNVGKVRKVVFAGVIAALYIALTIASYPLAFEAVQFRISEALAILPFFFPFAVPGLFIGVFIANLFGPYGLPDAIVGSSASLLAGLCTMWIGMRYRAKRRENEGEIEKESIMPKIFACFPPVIVNAVIIGAMIAYFMTSAGDAESFFTAFAFSGMWVGIGQLGVMYIIGLPLMIYLSKMRVIERLNLIYEGESQ